MDWGFGRESTESSWKYAGLHTATMPAMMVTRPARSLLNSALRKLIQASMINRQIGVREDDRFRFRAPEGKNRGLAPLGVLSNREHLPTR